MSAPHEETWEVDGDGDVRRVNRKGERTSLVWLRAASGTLEANMLGAAAPTLARALLAVRRPASAPACWCPPGYDTEKGHTMQCDNARTTLKRAGVPVP